MTTLYIRDVPPEVTQVLKERAAAEGASLSAYVSRELGKLAGRPTNSEVAARLRARACKSGPDAGEVLAAVQDARR